MSKTTSKTSELIKEMVATFPILITVHKAEDGGYWVEAPQLGGCFSAGKSVAEAIHSFKFAIFEYFDIPKKLQRPEGIEMRALDIPEPVSSKKPAVISFFPTSALRVA